MRRPSKVTSLKVLSVMISNILQFFSESFEEMSRSCTSTSIIKKVSIEMKTHGSATTIQISVFDSLALKIFSDHVYSYMFFEKSWAIVVVPLNLHLDFVVQITINEICLDIPLTILEICLFHWSFGSLFWKVM